MDQNKIEELEEKVQRILEVLNLEHEFEEDMESDYDGPADALWDDVDDDGGVVDEFHDDDDEDDEDEEGDEDEDEKYPTADSEVDVPSDTEHK